MGSWCRRALRTRSWRGSTSRSPRRSPSPTWPGALPSLGSFPRRARRRRCRRSTTPTWSAGAASSRAPTSSSSSRHCRALEKSRPNISADVEAFLPAAGLTKGGSGWTRLDMKSMTREHLLLVVLAALWGASYTFIKIGVETLPPVTLIAGRTLIAALLLLALARWRGLALPSDAVTWRRFFIQACLNSAIPFTLIAWGERWVDAGLATVLNSTAPIFTFLLTAVVTQ